MKVICLNESNSVLDQFISEIRDKNLQTDSMRFRENIKRIGHIEAYEISKYLTYQSKMVQTPLAECQSRCIEDQLVLATVLRAGLPLHQSFLDIFDKAENAFISAYRYYTDDCQKEIRVKVEYLASPSLEGKTLIITDPMLATGKSLDLTYDVLLSKGRPARLFIACVIAAKDGIEHLQKIFPSDDVILVCAAIDPILNSDKFIVPGLGDAGDLMFGVK